MIVAIASGKGGTGKTTLAVNLARTLPGAVQLLDCDVEAPNDHLFLHPHITTSTHAGIPVPRVDPRLCSLCGDCGESCQFNALAVLPSEVSSLNHSAIVACSPADSADMWFFKSTPSARHFSSTAL